VPGPRRDRRAGRHPLLQEIRPRTGCVN
jgi:hypothetical protein